jgi:hypothetical protein
MGILEGTPPTMTPAEPVASPRVPISANLRTGVSLGRMHALLRQRMASCPVDDLIVLGAGVPDADTSTDSWTEATDVLGPEGGLNRHLQWFASLRGSAPDPGARVTRDASATMLVTEIDLIFLFLADPSASFTADTFERAAHAAGIVARHVLQDLRWAEGADGTLVSRFTADNAPDGRGRGLQVTVGFRFRHMEGF